MSPESRDCRFKDVVTTQMSNGSKKETTTSTDSPNCSAKDMEIVSLCNNSNKVVHTHLPHQYLVEARLLQETGSLINQVVIIYESIIYMIEQDTINHIPSTAKSTYHNAFTSPPWTR